ncbi:MAG: T9SS type A sorting domain-containing protein [Saprospiraceae bacterium]
MKKFKHTLFTFTTLALGLLFCTPIAAQQYVNQVLNAGFNVDKSDWIFDLDGSNIASEIDPTGGYDGTGGLLTGYDTRIIQVFDLMDLGYSEDLLDQAPIVRFSVYAKGTGTNTEDQIRYSFELRDANGDNVEAFDSDWVVLSDDWRQITHNFINYGPGVRSIAFSIQAWDQEENQDANEGVMIDAINLSINNHMMYTNCSRTNDLAGWENIVDGGDGWDTSGNFQSSFSACSKGQTINLMDLGYSAEALDSEPSINVWEFILGFDGPQDGSGFDDTGFLNVELRDASGGVIESNGTGDVICTDTWQEISLQFSDYGPGLREIYVEHGGFDSEFWQGHYGHEVDATQLTMNFCNGFDVNSTVMNESQPGLDDGSIDLTVSGGIGNYTYAWGNGESSSSISNLAPDTYEVTITDEYGCTATEVFTITAGAVGTNDITGLSEFSVSPNPTNGMINISVITEYGMEGSLNIYDIRGKLIQSIQTGTIINEQYSVDLTNSPAGIYVAKLLLEDQVATERIIKN